MAFKTSRLLFSDKDSLSLAHPHKSTLLSKLKPRVEISFQQELHLRVCFVKQGLRLTPASISLRSSVLLAMSSIVTQRRPALVPGQEAHLILERQFRSILIRIRAYIFTENALLTRCLRNSKDLQSNGPWKNTASTDDSPKGSIIRGRTSSGEAPKEKPTQKRKHEAYTQDDRRRYSEISENILHMSKVESDTISTPISKGMFVGRNPDVVFKKVSFCRTNF